VIQTVHNHHGEQRTSEAEGHNPLFISVNQPNFPIELTTITLKIYFPILIWSPIYHTSLSGYDHISIGF